MRTSSMVLLILAMLLGTSSALFVGRVCLPLNVQVAPTDLKPKTSVLVAKKNLAPGTRMTAAMVKFELVAVDSLPVGAIVDFLQVVNRRVLYPIPAETPLSQLDLAELQPTEMIPYQANFRKIPVNIDRISADTYTGKTLIASSQMFNGSSSVGLFVDALLPESVIDLYLLTVPPIAGSTENRKFGNPNDESQLVLTNVKWENRKIQKRDNWANTPDYSVYASNRLHLLLNREQQEIAKKAAKEGRLQLVVSTRQLQSEQKPDLIVNESETKTDTPTNTIVSDHTFVPTIGDEEAVVQPVDRSEISEISDIIADQSPTQQQSEENLVKREPTEQFPDSAKRPEVIDIRIRRANRPLQIKPIPTNRDPETFLPADI